jgi:hypothetical protein
MQLIKTWLTAAKPQVKAKLAQRFLYEAREHYVPVASSSFDSRGSPET